MYNRLISIMLLVFCVNISAFDAGQSNINFDELFILDREKALKELVPGTEEYYHYHCLHYQSTKNREKFDELMGAWVKKFSNTNLYKQMLNRQALLDYEADPRKSLDHIIKELNLNYNFHKLAEERQIQYPNELDQNQISWDNLSKNSNIHSITDAGLELFSKRDLSWQDRRGLLKRVKHAGFPNLPKLVVDDLNAVHAGQFGYLPVHKLMTREQLDECLRLKPDLKNFSQFVNEYVLRLRPADHINWEQDNEHKSAYLNTLWTYVKDLNESFNSLKAHVLLQKLNHERSLGKFDEALFLEYLKLPRHVSYINHKYNNRKGFRNCKADLNANYNPVTGFKRVSVFENDLVQDFFEHIFKDAEDYKKFETFVDAKYLDNTFAEVKILHGIGDAEKWYARFNNSSYIKQLKDRIELRLLPQNSEFLGTENKTVIKAAVKNIPKLIVKTYRINLFNYYKRYGKQVSTDIDLDGLVAADEKTISYQQSPQIRHVENFELDLKENGVYIVELIGNGMSSRALVRKGQLRFSVTEGAAGHIFTVYDEANNQIKDAEIYLAGHVYKAGENGVIQIPYTKSNILEKIIIRKGDFSTLADFHHNQESYSLKAGFYINREALVKNGSAVLVIRPELLLNGNRIANKLLENVKLTITSTDSKNVSTSVTAEDFKLLDTRESFYTINVPEGIRSLKWTLSGEIKKMVDGETNKLQASSSIRLNQNQQNAQIAQAYLRESKGGYYIEVLGRTGEALKERGLNLQIKHKMVTNPYNVTLKTNELGEVKLGQLKDIESVTVQNSDIRRYWYLHEDMNFVARHYNADEDSTISIPFNWEDSPISDQVTLIELCNGKPVFLKTDKVTKNGEYLELKNLPSGTYKLYLKKEGTVLDITTLKGKQNKAYILADDRLIRQTNYKSPAISKVEKEGEGLKISLKNITPRTRVHIFQTRFTPDSIPALKLYTSSNINAHIYNFSRPNSQYLSERNIGDEYRYILTRRSGRVYPGNMLERPGLLLNPWILRTTNTGIVDSKPGQLYEGRSSAGRSSTISKFGGKAQKRGMANFGSAFDFMKAGDRTFTNLVPDKDGVVKIEKTGHGQTIHIVLLDGFNLQYKKAFIEDEKEPYRDLRLKVILDPEKHFIENKKISVLSRNKDFTLNSISSAKVETYDSLRKVYHLMKTINPDANLIEFGFILDWPQLKQEKKLELYSKYACHELNFFIFKKDQEFFNKIIVPYMSNKKGNTFLDHWLKNTATLKEYTEEWKYSRLNTVERILLAHKNKNTLIKREMKDNFDILKRDRNQLNWYFNSAVQSKTLALTGASKDNADFKGLLQQEANKAKERASRRMAEKEIQLNQRINLKKESKNDAIAAAPQKALDELSEEMAMEDADGVADPFGDDLVGGIGDVAGGEGGLERLKELRKNVRQYYREVGAVKEWVENNYYKLPIEHHIADLVKINAFWKDFAAHTDGAFISPNVAEATTNFTEMMFALSLLDLPFESGKIDSRLDNGKLVMKPENDLILFHREIEETAAIDSNIVLINQKYFDLQNRYKMEGNEKVEKDEYGFPCLDFLPPGELESL